MKKSNLLLFVIILFTACNTQKQAARMIGKHGAVHPEILAKVCANNYPVKESTRVETRYIKGETITTPGEIIEVDCDTVINVKKYIGNKVTIPCPEIKKQVDTIYKDSIVIVENTARWKDLDGINDGLISDMDDLTLKNDKIKKWLWRSGILNAVLILLIILVERYFRKTKPSL